MIRVVLPAEPPAFDQRCRRRGRAWLAANQGFGRPKDYWTEFKPALQEAARDLCAYSAMFLPNGEVDHFVPVALLKKRGRLNDIYEWSNLRYADEYLNKKKSDADILDPCQVRDDWFEILLPSLELVLTANVPRRHRRRAERTMELLGLGRGEWVMRSRRAFFIQYRQGQLTIEGLRRFLPQLARAVERDLAQGTDWRSIPLVP